MPAPSPIIIDGLSVFGIKGNGGESNIEGMRDEGGGMK
jgi:hypothetical protein